MADRFTRDWLSRRHKGTRMGTLWCGGFDIDGDVTLSARFDECSRIEKLDLLSDFIGLLKREYAALLNEPYGSNDEDTPEETL